jgi:hypothetical protein
VAKKGDKVGHAPCSCPLCRCQYVVELLRGYVRTLM